MQGQMHALLCSIADSIPPLKDEQSSALETCECQTYLSIVTSVSRRVAGVHQVKVIQQHKNDSCGYYSVFNLTMALSCILSPPDLCPLFSRQITNYAAFWLRFYEMKKILLRTAEDEGKKGRAHYPWTRKHIDGEYTAVTIELIRALEHVMERLYLHKIIEYDPWLSLLRQWMPHGEVLCGSVLSSQQTQMITESPYSYDSHDLFGFTFLAEMSSSTLKYNCLQVKNILKLEKIFERFHERREYAHAFMMGQTNHWLCLFIIKACHITHIANHHPILFYHLNNSSAKTDIDIRNDVKKDMDENPDRDRDEEEKREVMEQYVRSMVDTRDTCLLFHRCALGERNIVDTLVDVNISGFFENFETRTGPLNASGGVDGVDRDEFMCLFIDWLENWYPPAVIEANIQQTILSLGLERLGIEHRRRLMMWTKKVAWAVLSCEMKDATVDRFMVTLPWFQQHFGEEIKP
ncbi:hypothetical protein PROFUN_12251 [Planoprotostelium fungivorum]|uniref:Uncharacterized protein n=1 Tax=Planoprotostelium fungivorum TaxID=1890364 RepID=A0A2P6N818_9EUKA|nr:hypothetical protein PROFUN_12251 [Planoprotostelium fungivorum]